MKDSTEERICQYIDDIMSFAVYVSLLNPIERTYMIDRLKAQSIRSERSETKQAFLNAAINYVRSFK